MITTYLSGATVVVVLHETDYNPHRLAGRLRRQLAPRGVRVFRVAGTHEIHIHCDDRADALVIRDETTRLVASNPPPMRHG